MWSTCRLGLGGTDWSSVLLVRKQEDKKSDCFLSYHSVMFNFTAGFLPSVCGRQLEGNEPEPPSEASNLKHVDVMKDVRKYFTERHSGCFPSLGMRGASTAQSNIALLINSPLQQPPVTPLLSQITRHLLQIKVKIFQSACLFLMTNDKLLM